MRRASRYIREDSPKPESTFMKVIVPTFVLEDVHSLELKCGIFKKEHLLETSILKTGHHFKVSTFNHDSGVKIDGELIERVSQLPSDIKLDISNVDLGGEVCGGNITLIHKSATMKFLSAIMNILFATMKFFNVIIRKSATMKFLNIRGIEIDTKIAEAVSRLPDDVQLDLSGNKLAKIVPTLLDGVLVHMHKDEEIDITGWETNINADIVRALSEMPQLKSLKASNNKLTPEAAREFSLSQLQHLELSRCGINDNVCASLMTEQCPSLEVLDLSNGRLRFNRNNLTNDEWCQYIQMKQLSKLDLSDCGINDTVCESLMKSLSEQCPLLEVLDLADNNLTSDKWCDYVQMNQLRELILSRCGINDNVCKSLMISLSKHSPLLEKLNIGNNWNGEVSNNLTSTQWCHHVQMKKLRELYLSKCGINETVCESLMISLSRHCPLLEVLDLGWNNLSSSGLRMIVDHIKYMKQLREVNLCIREEQLSKVVRETLEKSNPGLKVNIGRII